MKNGNSKQIFDNKTMDTLTIQATGKSPLIHCTKNTRQINIEIKGISIHKNILHYYDTLRAWLRIYKETILNIHVNIIYNYYNTITSHCLYSLFHDLQFMQKNGATIIINWHHDTDDECMQDNGSDFKNIFKQLTINLLENKQTT